VDKAPDAFRTISEVAAELAVPQHVLRFWESRFHEIRPMKRGGGRRFYRPQDVDLLRGIRHLLYGEGYTIRGVQRILREQGQKFVQNVWQPGAPQPTPSPADRASEEAADENDREWEPPEHHTKNESPSSGAPVAPAPSSTLSDEHVRKLHTILDELTECRRMLDGAVTQRSDS
jgi:DNA-binding transcriptional MerR regulator